MTTQVITELNSAQSSIYSRSNIRRAYPDFDDTEIAGIHLSGESVIVVRVDGSQQSYERKSVIDAYQEFTGRLKDYFSYLGPNYRGPSIWRNNAYIMFKGWHYSHKLGYLSEAACFQRAYADKLIHINDKTKLIHLLQSDQTDIGHLIAPDGFEEATNTFDFDSAEETEDEQGEGVPELQKSPYCSCGSFQRQLNNLSEFEAEIQGFKPWCIHLTWMKRYRQFLVKRSEVRSNSRSQTSEQAVAWWYAPPEGTSDLGRFLLLYTKHGSMAPVQAWRTYKPKEIFTQHDVWNLFDSMLDNGFVPFPATSLPQLKQVWKQKQQSAS